MSQPRIPETLARIGGLSPTPSAPQDSVLLMIDGQREYTRGIVDAQTIQQGTLAALSDRFSIVVQDTDALGAREARPT